MNDAELWRKQASADAEEISLLRAEVKGLTEEGHKLIDSQIQRAEAAEKALHDVELQVGEYRKGLEDVLRVAPGIFVPASDTEPAYTCSCCRSKDGYVRGALGITVVEKRDGQSRKCGCLALFDSHHPDCRDDNR